MNLNLSDLTDRDLIALGVAIRSAQGHAGFGQDAARLSKAQKAAYILSHYTEAAIRDQAQTLGFSISPAPIGATGGQRALSLDPPTPEPDAPDPALAKLHAPKTPKTADAERKLGPVLAEAMREIAAEQVASAVADGFAKLPKPEPSVVSFKLDLPEGMPSVDLQGKHPLFSKLLALSLLPKDLRVHIMLVGPAGCGKTTLCGQVAAAREAAFSFLSFSAGVTESALLGRLLPGEGGRWVWVSTPFVDRYTLGGFFLADEVDAADANVLVVLNSALSNGHLAIEARAAVGLDPVVAKHADTVILMAANTFGNGADTQYVGRGQLDAAFLDRVLTLPMDYDRSLQAAIMGVSVAAPAPWRPTASLDQDEVRRDLAQLHGWIGKVEAHKNARSLQRVVSVRMFQKARALRAIGCPVSEIKADLLAGWTRDEIGGLINA